MKRHSGAGALGFILVCAAAQVCSADTVTYDASSGLLPDQSGWVYTETGGGPTSISVSGGLLSLNTDVTPRASWNYDLLGANNASGTNVFMDSIVRVNSETHTSSNRGVSIFELERTTQGSSGFTNEVDGYAWADRIFWTNSVGAVVGSAMVDTSVFHDYRLELDGNNAFIYIDGKPVGAVLNNTYQNGSSSQPDVLRAHFGDSTVASGSSTDWKSVTAGPLSSSVTQDQPVLPSETVPPGTGGSIGGVYVFNNVPSGRWYDPPISSGFIYTMTSGALFTEIEDFPTGFNSPFTITADGHQFTGSPGHPVDFLSLLGHGVSTFTVTGIDPHVDPTNPSSFPLLLDFDSPTADFTMAAVTPEPSTLILLSSVLGTVGVGRFFRRKRTTVDRIG